MLVTPAIGCQGKVYIGVPIHGDEELVGDGAPLVDSGLGEADGLPPLVDWYLHASGATLLDSNNNEVRLKGINWAGMESTTRVADGLQARTLDSLLDQIQSLGFNLIRIPFSDESVQPDAMPVTAAANGNVDPIAKNPDLSGLRSLEILDRIVAGARDRGLRILLDRYRFTASATPPSPLWWYSDFSVTDPEWIGHWKDLASRYVSNSIVVGFDLHEEPAHPAVWDSADSTISWRSAAERAAQEIFKVNSKLLIVVQGVDVAGGVTYWPGGNLLGVKNAPVGIPLRQLAYSIHDYGRSVRDQPWFTDPTYPNNLQMLWDTTWGYLATTAPVIVGSFGDNKDEMPPPPPDVVLADEAWRQKLVTYMNANRISYIFWSLSPSAEGKKGLLQLSDWATPDPAWSQLLQLK